MKRHFVLAAAVALSLGVSLFALPSAEATITSKEMESVPRIEVHDPIPVKIIADYRKEGFSGLLDLGTITDMDDAKDYPLLNKLLDGHTAPATSNAGYCSSVMKVLPFKGQKIVTMARNMDLPGSDYPAYIFRTNQPGKYKTINIGYTNTSIESFEQIAETSTVDKLMFDFDIYTVSDVMNEKGLMLEANMRATCPELVCTGTNPGKFRICELEIMRYLADHCATIEEALQTLNDLDVYTTKSQLSSWHLAFAMADATGRYGVLEFIKNKPVFTENYPGQANFWVNKEARQVAPLNIGLGRWAKAMQMLHHAQNQADMQKILNTIHYKPFYNDDAQDWPYDPATEMTETVVAHDLASIRGWIKKFGIKVAQEDLDYLQKLADEQKETAWTTEWVQNPDNQATVYKVNDIIAGAMRQLPVSTRKLSGRYEISAVSYVANPIEKVYHVRFFETGKTYDFGFDGLKAH